MTQWGLDNLFNPGKRHMDDEKRRLQSTREEIGDNSGGRRIDLEGGTVSISVRRGATTDPAGSVDPVEPVDAAAVGAVEDLADPAPDTALDPALAAEDAPALALAGDEAEIAPAVVDEAVPPPVDESVEGDPVGAQTVPAVEHEPEPAPEPAPESEPVPEPEPAPEPPAARPTTTLSARAWARRG